MKAVLVFAAVAITVTGVAVKAQQATPGAVPPCPTPKEQAVAAGQKARDGTEVAPARPHL